VAGYVEAEYPIPADRAARKTLATDPVAATRHFLVEKIVQQEIRPWQFWRVVRDEPFVRERIAAPGGAYDDLGRGLVLATAFRLRGGIAPFLILWLAPLLALPVLAWIAFEAVRARAAVGGGVFLVLLGLSPYALESLALVRSAVGFYLLALLVLVPLAVYAILGPPPTTRGLLARFAAASVLFGVCALCRSGALFVLPAVLVILAIAAARMADRRIAIAAFALFLVPYAVLRPAQHHDVWAAVWEGLGDFDRTKGHVWSDPVAEEHVRARGAPARLSDEGMAIMRSDVIDHVKGDPAWYAGILARRVLAVVTQSRLWPTLRGDGLWMRRSASPNEGFMDKYYAYTTTADFLGFGPDHKVELPVWLILLPSALLLAWGAVDRAHRGRAAATAVLMLAALPLPVLITTAGGMEPQAFVLACMMGAALLADAAAGEIRNRMEAKGRIHGTWARTAPGLGDR
jgi:hypothetical protein